MVVFYFRLGRVIFGTGLPIGLIPFNWFFFICVSMLANHFVGKHCGVFFITPLVSKPLVYDKTKYKYFLTKKGCMDVRTFHSVEQLCYKSLVHVIKNDRMQSKSWIFNGLLRNTVSFNKMFIQNCHKIIDFISAKQTFFNYWHEFTQQIYSINISFF